jgi:hypothetical protein
MLLLLESFTKILAICLPQHNAAKEKQHLATELGSKCTQIKIDCQHSIEHFSFWVTSNNRFFYLTTENTRGNF